MTPRKRRTSFIPPDQLVHEISQLALSKKAENICILDVRKQTSITDFFLICSGSTDVHVKAIHDAIIGELGSRVRPWHVEGLQNRLWILMDYVDVVIHIFQQEARDFYQLERLWADAPCEIVEDQPSAGHQPAESSK